MDAPSKHQIVVKLFFFFLSKIPMVPREQQPQRRISGVEREALTGDDKLEAAVTEPLLTSIENIHQ